MPTLADIKTMYGAPATLAEVDADTKKANDAAIGQCHSLLHHAKMCIRDRYYYDPFEVLEKIKGYKQYGNRHLSKEKIDEYCNSVKEAKEKSLEK